MKRFAWRLQRVLDITEKREQALRLELGALARDIVLVRQEILTRQMIVRTLLDDLAARPLTERLPEQSVVLATASVERRILDKLRARQAELEAARDAKTEQYLRTRGTRRTLERLREEARLRYLRAAARVEQTQFDEAAHIAYGRKDRPHARPHDAAAAMSAR
jgi:flagellar biosynthesis chaperone FliJ